jgi:amino acid transporter
LIVSLLDPVSQHLPQPLQRRLVFRVAGQIIDLMPARLRLRFLPVMFWALAVGTLFYVAVVGVVALLQPWPTLLEVPFPTAAAFERAFGWHWLVQVIMFGVLLSLLKVYNGNFLAGTRLLYAMGRRALLGGPLGKVHGRFQTPASAVILVGAMGVLGPFLGRQCWCRSPRSGRSRARSAG